MVGRKIILDVGCGTNPKGDVNCDLIVGKTIHRWKKDVINPKEITNFVRCDAQHLPFKNATFSIVYSSHTLEHVENPKKMLREMIRVSSWKVFFRVPHRFSVAFTPKEAHKSHKWIFNVSSLEKLVKTLNVHYSFKIRYRDFPHKFIPLIRLPEEIHCTIYKRGEI